MPVFGEDGSQTKDEEGINIVTNYDAEVHVEFEDPYWVFTCDDPKFTVGSSISVRYSDLRAKTPITSEEEAVAVFCEQNQVEVV